MKKKHNYLFINYRQTITKFTKTIKHGVFVNKILGRTYFRTLIYNSPGKSFTVLPPLIERLTFLLNRKAIQNAKLLKAPLAYTKKICERDFMKDTNLYNSTDQKLKDLRSDEKVAQSKYEELKLALKESNYHPYYSAQTNQALKNLKGIKASIVNKDRLLDSLEVRLTPFNVHTREVELNDELIARVNKEYDQNSFILKNIYKFELACPIDDHEPILTALKSIKEASKLIGGAGAALFVITTWWTTQGGDPTVIEANPEMVDQFLEYVWEADEPETAISGPELIDISSTSSDVSINAFSLENAPTVRVISSLEDAVSNKKS